MEVDFAIIILIIVIILYICYKKITKDNLTVYTQNRPVTGSTGPLDMTETFEYPTCVGTGTTEQCVMSAGGNIYQGYLYNTTDSRCFKSKTDQSVNRLESAYDKTYDMDEINTYFESCQNGNNMYLPTIGRYVRIQRPVNNTTPIKIGSLIINISDSLTGPTISPATPVDIHKQPAIDTTTALITGNGTITSPAYIQADLLDDKIIQSIEITRHPSDTNGSFINGCVLYIMKTNPVNSSSIVTFQTILTDV